MQAGANTGRIRTTLQRISESFDLHAEVLLNHRGIFITIENEVTGEVYTGLKRTLPHGVNFKIVSGISRMSWKIAKDQMSIDEINDELDRLVTLKHYSRPVLLFLVALAGASFCRIAGGGIQDMLIAFVATVAGLYVRQEAHKMSFNPYLCVFFASFTASLVAGFGFFMKIASPGNFGYYTSVLFLIPGVPLMNSFSDLIDGNIQTGLARGINSLMIAFAIALGLLATMFIYHYQ